MRWFKRISRQVREPYDAHRHRHDFFVEPLERRCLLSASPTSVGTSDMDNQDVSLINAEGDHAAYSESDYQFVSRLMENDGAGTANGSTADDSSCWMRVSQVHAGNGSGETVGVNYAETVGAAQQSARVGGSRTISVGAAQSITVGAVQS